MSTAVADQEVALIDLVDRLLGGGVVIAGDITLAPYAAWVAALR